ncbi:MAG: tetratricopeptide repeat protein [Pseudomonadales bacterium]|jgi:tetratricopeptide (TPR) repeat protein
MNQLTHHGHQLAVAWLLVVAAGCTGVAIDDAEPATESASSTPTESPATATATLALLQQSERAASGGSLAEAIAYLERAIRIEPRRADLWVQLAQLEIANQQPTAAIQYANKALALAGTRTDWQRDAWLVIADAKAAQGDLEDASRIRERWRSYRG